MAPSYKYKGRGRGMDTHTHHTLSTHLSPLELEAFILDAFFYETGGVSPYWLYIKRNKHAEFYKQVSRNKEGKKKISTVTLMFLSILTLLLSNEPLHGV